MVKRKIASILIKNNWSCIAYEDSLFPLWEPQSHVNYISESDYSDIIISIDKSFAFDSLALSAGKNYILSCSWSNVTRIPEIFSHGYSKIFFGGSQTSHPSVSEKPILMSMLAKYGASSFGLNIHVDDYHLDFIPDILGYCNEITIIHNKLQLINDESSFNKLVEFIDEIAPSLNHDLNMIVPIHTYLKLSRIIQRPINFVNYCHHGVSLLR